jgi:hypothetical protein
MFPIAPPNRAGPFKRFSTMLYRATVREAAVDSLIDALTTTSVQLTSSGASPG